MFIVLREKDPPLSFFFHLVSLRQLSSRDTVRYTKDRKVKAIPLLDDFTEWKVSVKSDNPFRSFESGAKTFQN